MEGIFHLYRGLLQHPDYCNPIQRLKDLNLLNDEEIIKLQGITYRQFMASVVGANKGTDIRQAVVDKLNLKVSSDIIKQIQWLDFFDDLLIHISKGSKADVLLNLMQEKLIYKDYEKDMIIVHNKAVVETGMRTKKRMATMKVEGRVLWAFRNSKSSFTSGSHCFKIATGRSDTIKRCFNTNNRDIQTGVSRTR